MVVRWNGSSRTTIVVSANQLLALITSSNLAVAGTYAVTAYSTSDGVTSNAISFNVTNPSPEISSLNPAAAAANSSSVIHVLGSNFVSTSVVYVNGSSYPTSFIDRGNLQVTVPAGVLSIASPSAVTVVNPAPGGGTSGPRMLYAYLSLQGRDMIYDPFTRLIYVSVSGAGGAIGNTITEIDPAAGTIGRSFYIGSEPNKLAITNDGQLIYASLDGAAAVRVFDIPSRTPGLQFTLGSDNLFGPYYVEDIAIMPGNNRVVAVSRMNKGVSPRHAGVAIYENGIMRPQVTARHTGSNIIEFSASPSTLYGYNNETTEYGFRKMLVDASGVTITNVTQNLIMGNGVIKFENGHIYSTSGMVLDPEAMTLLGSYGLPYSFGNWVQPDSSVGRTFFLADTSSSTKELLSFNQSTFAFLGSQEIGGVSGSIRSFIRWGANGIAFLTDSGQLHVLRSNLVLPLDTSGYAPGISLLVKNSKKGGGNFFLTVYGAGFVPGAAACFNGEERTTYFINDTELRVAIPASDIQTKGFAEITVSNPGASSNRLSLKIE